MKLATHVVSGFCVAVATSFFLGLDPRLSIFSGILAALANYITDVVGHDGTKRNPLHSFVGVTLLLAGMMTMIVAISVIVPPPIPLEMLLGPRTIASVALGTYLHLLLDAFTEGGIYPLYPVSRKRFAVAHLDYDNPIANAITTALAIALLLYVAWLRYGYLAHEVFRTWFAK